MSTELPKAYLAQSVLQFQLMPLRGLTIRMENHREYGPVHKKNKKENKYTNRTGQINPHASGLNFRTSVVRISVKKAPRWIAL
jgi:hypothetical protein